MNTGKKLAIFLGLATGAAVAVMAFGRTGKKITKNILAKRETKVEETKKANDTEESEINYI